MARTPKADYRPLMIEAARRRLELGEEVSIAAIAAELGVSPGLVHFYFGDRQALVDAAWRSILTAFTTEDQTDVDEFAASTDWNGVAELVRRIFSEERDNVHLSHVRASVEGRHNAALAGMIDDTTWTAVASWKSMMDYYSELGVVATPLDTEALALLFVAVPMGVAVVAPELTDHHRATVAEAWSTMIRAVLDPTFHVSVSPPVIPGDISEIS